MRVLADALGLSEPVRGQLLAAARHARRTTAGDARVVDLEPHRLADFTGREAEIRAVVDHLAPSPSSASSPDGATAPVVLCGTPGVGKTSIAVEALHRHVPDRHPRLFVALGALDVIPLAPLQVLQSLLRQLTGEQDVPKTLGAAVATWRAAVETTPVAVLLDDAASEDQVRPVLSARRPSVVVVTSRRTLAGLEGARRLQVGPLPRTEGVELLRRILSPAQAGSGDLDELARLCADVPLALRIAGNRLATQPSWSVDDIVRRLGAEERRLRTLSAGDLAVESAFELSYAHLDEPSRTLFRRLSLLDGASFDARLAGAVGDLDAEDAQDLLDGLVGLGLVEALTGDRYRLHDLLRLYAASRLRSEESAPSVSARRRRLREWLLATTTEAGSWFEPRRPVPVDADLRLDFSSDDDARHWLITESEHWFAAYRDAAARGDHATVLAVADSLHWFSDLWLGWGHWHELYAASAAAAAAVDDPGQQARHLGYLAWTQIVETRDPSAAHATSERALHAARLAGDLSQRGWASFYLAWSRLVLGDVPAADSAADDAVDDFAAAGDVEGGLQARSIRAQTRSLKDPGLGVLEYRGLVEFVRSAGDGLPGNIRAVAEVNAHASIAATLVTLRRYDEAVVAASDALAVALRHDFVSGQARAHRHRGTAAAALGRHDDARADLASALSLGTGVQSEAWLDEVAATLAGLPDAQDT